MKWTNLWITWQEGVAHTVQIKRMQYLSIVYQIRVQELHVLTAWNCTYPVWQCARVWARLIAAAVASFDVCISVANITPSLTTCNEFPCAIGGIFGQNLATFEPHSQEPVECTNAPKVIIMKQLS